MGCRFDLLSVVGHRAALLAVAAVCWTGAGCLEDLPSAAIVTDLRVLAIQAEPPEASPGATVAITSLVVDPENRPISYRWALCLLPERGFGFFSGGTAPNSGSGFGLEDPGNCVQRLRANDPDAVDLGSEPTAQFTIPADFFDDLTTVKDVYELPQDVEIPDLVITGLLTIAGLNLTVTLEVVAGDEVVTANKRINASLAPGDAANRNPEGLAFYLYEAPTGDTDLTETPPTAPVPPGNACFTAENDGPLTIKPGKWRVAPVNIPDPPIDYQAVLPALDPQMPFELLEETETYFHSFFSTEGAFGREIIKATANTRGEWVIPAQDEPVPVWIVTRDGRGGVHWCHSMVTVAAE